MKKLLKAVVTMTVTAGMLFAASAVTSAAEPKVNVPALYYGNESVAVTKEYSYTNETKLSETECGMVIPLEVSAPGTIKLNINYTRLEKTVYAYVYTDEACTNRINIMGSASNGTTQKEGYVSVSNAGTYYLKFYTYTYSTDLSQFTNGFTVTVSQYTSTDKVIKSGETISYYRSNGSDPFYFQYKAKKNGKVTVTLPYSAGSYITLLNAKKKALSEQEWVSDVVGGNKFSFAVKKGTTYYFLVKSNGTGFGNIQTISVKQTAIKEKSGAKKSKAVNIKIKKKVKGTILPANKTADWYKFTLKKSKSVTINFAGDITGSLKISVYDKSGRSYGSFISNGNTLKLKPLYGKFQKGTYYIKIARSNAKSSGAYTLSWK